LKRERESEAKNPKAPQEVRVDKSREAAVSCLKDLSIFLASRRTGDARIPASFRMRTDLKIPYVSWLRAIFGGSSFTYEHERFSSKIRRDTRNPLFKINHADAEHRYHLAPLIRDTWCHAKTEESLKRSIAMYRVYRNFTRWVRNKDRVTPAMKLGLATMRHGPDALFHWNRKFSVEQLRALGAIAA